MKKKTKSIRAEIVAHQGDVVTLKLYDAIDRDAAIEKAVDGRYFVNLDFYEFDSITDLQRDHFYALCGDIEETTGYPRSVVEDYLKYKFYVEEDLSEFPSLARGAMRKSTASKLLEFVIDFCIDQETPFRKQQFYLTMDTTKMLFSLTMKRICWICGRPKSDIAHVEAIGMGADRKTVNHTKYHFMCLCRKHHMEQHQIGIETFMSKYFVKPVRLNEEQLKELGVM